MAFVNLCESLGKKVQSKQFHFIYLFPVVLEKNVILLTWHKSSLINKDRVALLFTQHRSGLTWSPGSRLGHLTLKDVGNYLSKTMEEPQNNQNSRRDGTFTRKKRKTPQSSLD